MSQLSKAVGNPPGLAISSDASKGLANAISSTFPGCEHRECMRHLMENLKKRYHGDVFDNHMWPASKAYTVQECQFHLSKIREKSPEAIAYLENHHNLLWCRSMFSEDTKCDYVVNNLAESFNNWIKDFKELHVIDLMDRMRRRIMVTFDKRRNMAKQMNGVIIASVLKQLHKKSRNLRRSHISRGGDTCAEVSGTDSSGKPWRYAVDLEKRDCTCREWQLCGKPCGHAIAFISSIRGAHMEGYVHDYFSIARYRAAYEGVIRPISATSQWPQVDIGFTVWPPKMKRPAGRPRKKRIPGCLEAG